MSAFSSLEVGLCAEGTRMSSNYRSSKIVQTGLCVQRVFVFLRFLVFVGRKRKPVFAKSSNAMGNAKTYNEKEAANRNSMNDIEKSETEQFVYRMTKQNQT